MNKEQLIIELTEKIADAEAKIENEAKLLIPASQVMISAKTTNLGDLYKAKYSKENTEYEIARKQADKVRDLLLIYRTQLYLIQNSK